MASQPRCGGAGNNAGDFFREIGVRTEGLPGVAHSWQFFVTQSFSSLTRRIVFLNVFGLFALVVSIAPLEPGARRPDRGERA